VGGNKKKGGPTHGHLNTPHLLKNWFVDVKKPERERKKEQNFVTFIKLGGHAA